ncbi:MAG: dihydropteroate synthase, partial [Planctomycetota bacterium]|nr:dihydropteroate synthase [Planctomycetota bacterium]
MNGPWRLDGLRSVETDPPAVMAVLNCTPDSFSDGGDHFAVEAAVEAGLAAVKAGATILDIGGESTRPGAERIDPAEQIRRVCPVVSALREHTDVALSVDTTRAEVADAALQVGVNAINDVSAGSEDPGMFDLAAEKGCGLVLMHRGAPPPDDQW